MKSPVTIVLLALVSFTLGWWVGHTGAQDYDQRQRLEAVERRVAALAGRAGGAAGPGPDAPGGPPGAAAEPVEIRLAGAPARGPEDARVTLVEFTDFECPFCVRAHPTVEKLRADYPDDLRVVFKHFPLSFHKRALNAHRAVLAAGEQDRFWEMHDRIFDNVRALDVETMRAHAQALGLDMARFDAAFNSPKTAQAIDQDIEEGKQVGVRGTPAFFINGTLLSGAQPYEVFRQRIEEELAGAS